MIPRAHITEWRSKAPWSTDAQVEQDLVICRAVVDLFGDELLAREVAFRGGTALHKLYFQSPGRYSEDIDLVQVNAGPIGPVMDAVRARLYQRKKGRDLFDLSEALTRITGLDAEKVVTCFTRYLENDGRRVTRTELEENLAEKIDDKVFLSDVPPLLALGVSFDPAAALGRVRDAFFSRLPESESKKRKERKRP
ncbi:MAG: nucleotidyl transferase AbiEii/AbiGii toxin family protein [Myxococcaceae bacterium]